MKRKHDYDDVFEIVELDNFDQERIMRLAHAKEVDNLIAQSKLNKEINHYLESKNELDN